MSRQELGLVIGAEGTAFRGRPKARPGRVAASVRPTARSRADAWPLDDELRATAAAWGIVPERDLVLV